jgi:endonuclease YncB( thermonuclease family)
MTGNLLICFVFLFCTSISPVQAGEVFSGSVKKIIDGDSLLIASGKKNIEVRLYGVDCPEYNQPFSHEAKALVRKQVYGKRVLVQPQYYDSYGRLVAIVDYGDQTLNSELVGAGLAWVYPRYCRKKICQSWQDMEDAAKNDHRGLWGAKQPISPWKWKRMKHGN